MKKTFFLLLLTGIIYNTGYAQSQNLSRTHKKQPADTSRIQADRRNSTNIHQDNMHHENDADRNNPKNPNNPVNPSAPATPVTPATNPKK